MVELSRHVAELDISSRAGLLLGAYCTGASYQPNLLSRGTRDQALITGVAAASAFGWGTSMHSALRSVADRLPTARRSETSRAATGAVVDAVVLAAGLGMARALPPREHEPSRRALVRLAATTMAAAAAAGLGADALEVRRGRVGNRVGTLTAALATAGVSYWLTRPGRATSGAWAPGDENAHENVHRAVSMPKAVGSGVAVTLGLVVAARGETALSSVLSKGAAKALGGDAQDHRTLGRLASFGVLAGAGWGAVTMVNRMLTKSGDALETAHAAAPELAEVTGGPGSTIPWADQSRESGRWLTMVLRPDAISEVMAEKAKQPIRVYASLDSADSSEERAGLLLAEIDRTRALERSAIAIFSPTGSGYVNYVACETFEYLTRGDCASIAIQYSVLPSALSLTKVTGATHQTRMVVNGIVERLLDLPASSRPKFFLFGESLGSQVSEEMFQGQGIQGPAGAGLDAALWIGTPAATKFRKELWGTRTVTDAPALGPGPAYLPRAIRDWAALSPVDREQVRFLFLQNGDDPVPKFGSSLLWKRPDWLGPDDTRPPGAPRGTRWLPITTFFTTFVDLQNALAPTPGVFDEGGHDYRREIPDAIRRVFQLDATEEQMSRVEAALRARELRWAVARAWQAAAAKPSTERAAAEQAVIDDLRTWTGEDADETTVVELIGSH